MTHITHAEQRRRGLRATRPAACGTRIVSWGPSGAGLGARCARGQLLHPRRYKFNCAQRGHQNALETLPAALASLFAAGAVFPVTASVLAGAFGVGRLLYARGYRRRGPNGRVIGVVIADIGAAAAHATLRPLLTAALALILHDDRAGLLGLIGCAIRAGGKVRCRTPKASALPAYALTAAAAPQKQVSGKF